MFTSFRILPSQHDSRVVSVKILGRRPPNIRLARAKLKNHRTMPITLPNAIQGSFEATDPEAMKTAKAIKAAQ